MVPCDALVSRPGCIPEFFPDMNKRSAELECITPPFAPKTDCVAFSEPASTIVMYGIAESIHGSERICCQSKPVITNPAFKQIADSRIHAKCENTQLVTLLRRPTCVPLRSWGSSEYGMVRLRNINQNMQMDRTYSLISSNSLIVVSMGTASS